MFSHKVYGFRSFISSGLRIKVVVFTELEVVSHFYALIS